MSEDENEMVTISYEVTPDEAEAMANSDSDCWPYKARKAARAALDARKSLYDRWRETVFLPWERVPGNAATVTDMRFNVRPGIHSASSHSDEMDKLTGAAPEMLQALIDEWNDDREEGRVPQHATELAIKLALPPDVAKEQLGE